MSNLERHRKICDDIHNLYAQKNHDYGDSFSKARKVVPHYTLGKLYDKFSRYMTLSLNPESQRVKSESIKDTLMDLANYAIMELTEMEDDDNGNVEP